MSAKNDSTWELERRATIEGEKVQKLGEATSRLKYSWGASKCVQSIHRPADLLQFCCSHHRLSTESSFCGQHVITPVGAGAAGTCVHARGGRRGDWMGTGNSLDGDEEDFVLEKTCTSGLFRRWATKPRGLHIQHRGRETHATMTIKRRTAFKSWGRGRIRQSLVS